MQYRAFLLKHLLIFIALAYGLIMTALFGAAIAGTEIVFIPVTLTPDPLALTATAIVARATQMAAGTITTPTPIPTLSSMEAETFRKHWLKNLEDEIGFIHPVLEETVDEITESLNSNLDIINYTGYGFNPLSHNILRDVKKTIFEEREYVAVVLRTYDFSRVFIFEVRDNLPILLLDSKDLHYLPFAVLNPFADQLGELLDVENSTPVGFADRNGNSLPDISIHFNNHGSNPTLFMTIFEINSNDELINLTDDLDARVFDFVDLDGDNIWELQAVQSRYIPEKLRPTLTPYSYSVQDIIVWFRWSGEAYERLPLTEDENENQP